MHIFVSFWLDILQELFHDLIDLLVFSLFLSDLGMRIASQSLIKRIIAQSEKLAHELIRLASQSIMIHSVCDEPLAVLDSLNHVVRVLKMHVHIIHITGRVDGDFVVRQLIVVVQRGPVVCGGKDFGDFSELIELGV
jgi:hypothetical protein